MTKLSKLTLFSIFSLIGSLSAGRNTLCEPTSHPQRVTVRAIEGKGVGYHTGYTTIEGFFTAPSLMDTAWVPFFDLRGHVFNDGKWAANGGVGIRYVGSSQVWGINSYYDFRQTRHKDFNQYGLGLECLGRVFDFRINGYLPFGKKESRFYGTKFDHFEGNTLILSQKRDVAFKGANAEVGFHAKVSDGIKFYSAAGPYFIDHGSRNAWGGELRVAFDFTQYLRLEGNTSYDRIFKWIGQGQISVNIPFGSRDKIKRKGSNSCAKQLMLRDRALQRVDRDEIIVTEKRRTHATATDPATGLPFFFIFVNNTSHSSGTYESPYPTLTEAETNSAPGNIILVSSGNGSAYTNQFITLKDNQKLWGTGISYKLKTTEGTVKIPILSAFPTISTTVATSAVTVGNNCEVAGLNFSNIMAPAILGGDITLNNLGITNTFIHNNIISNGADGGIVLYSCLGNLQIINNQLTDIHVNIISNGAIDIENQPLNVLTSPVNSFVTIEGNTVSNSDFGNIHVYAGSPAGSLTLYMVNNNVHNINATYGILVVNDQQQTVCGTLVNNTSSDNGAGGLIVSASSGAGPTSYNVFGNTFLGNTGNGFTITNHQTTCLSLQRNTSLNNTASGYSLQNLAGPLQVENLAKVPSSNVGTISTIGTLTSVSAGACTCD